MTEESRVRIASVSRRSVTFLDGSGMHVTARVSGNVYKTCHPVVGDIALLRKETDEPIVTEILPRKTVLERTSSLGQKKQIIAANVDLVLVIASLREPRLKRGFIDRAVAASEWQNLKAAIVINKIDLASGEADRETLAEILSDYGPDGAGYDILPLSCKTGQGVDQIRDRLRGLSVVMTGQSGTGKSSLAKRLNPDLDLATGEVNRKTAKGRHTTVKARLFPLGGETYLIDTPGLRTFSIDHVPVDELGCCFIEFTELEDGCRFRNCLHDSEPGCAVREAVESGDLSRNRYNSYRNLLNELREVKRP